MLSALPCEFRAVCLRNRGAGGSAISWRTLRLLCNRSLSYNNVTVRSLYKVSPFGYSHGVGGVQDAYPNRCRSGFGAFQNRPMPAKQNQSTPLGIKIDT